MAQMIPDRMPSDASQGEKKLFAILQQLPEDFLVYYEPVIDLRYPDFVIIAPTLGLMVIEVKGWTPGEILSADSNEIKIKHRGKETIEKHPVRQARDYMLRLMDFCRKHRGFEILLHDEGPHTDRFLFPFGHFAILSNITTSQLTAHNLGDLTPVFSTTKVVTRDQFETWQTHGQNELVQRLETFFDPKWPIKPLTEGQINILRAIIHPEVRLDANPVVINASQNPEITPEISIAVLDLRQENLARSIGDGHRLIYGVAGSGKTVMLISRARMLAARPDAKILFLCFNVPLATDLANRLKDCKQVEVLHFDGWAKKNGMVRRKGERSLELGKRLFDHLEAGYGDARSYDAILIDEAQDFEPTWFQAVLAGLKEPNDGDLLIVGDGSQGLYRKAGISWKELGIKARGRTVSKNFDLHRNYRNTREILSVAHLFATSSNLDQDEGTESFSAKPENSLRSTGILPRLIVESNRDQEVQRVAEVVKGLLSGTWAGGAISPALTENQIAILYPRLNQQLKEPMARLQKELKAIANVVWITDPDADNRRLIGSNGVKIQTIHSVKGLQYRAVILIAADLLPSRLQDQDEETDRRLMYVALTRPEDYLLITGSKRSTFIDEIERSGCCQIG